MLDVKVYHKQPTIVEAVEYLDGRDIRNGKAIEEWSNGKVRVCESNAENHYSGENLVVSTRKGPVFVQHGDFILKNSRGEFFAIDYVTFFGTYQQKPYIVEERERKHNHDWTYAGSAETLEEARKIANLSPKSAGVRIIQVAEVKP